MTHHKNKLTMYQHIKIPAHGQKITVNADMSLNVPDQPIIPYIKGDGTGLDITPVMIKVVDAAVARSYGGKQQDSTGWRFTPARNRPTCMALTYGCPKKLCTRYAITWSPSKAR
jgi:hypothetical protein